MTSLPVAGAAIGRRRSVIVAASLSPRNFGGTRMEGGIAALFLAPYYWQSGGTR